MSAYPSRLGGDLVRPLRYPKHPSVGSLLAQKPLELCREASSTLRLGFLGSQKPHILEPVYKNYNQMSGASAERCRDRKYEVRNNQKHPDLEIVTRR